VKVLRNGCTLPYSDMFESVQPEMPRRESRLVDELTQVKAAWP
jgi:hypothetical protein